MEIIRRATLEVKQVFELNFRYKNEKGHGFVFECNKLGVPVLKTEQATQNYIKCINSDEIECTGISSRIKKVYHPATGICPHCGKEIEIGNVSRCTTCYSIYDRLGREVFF